ncbi:hypothetical protein [Candidatus Cyanaurora vandensis]|uniref:hypothetical protein n=1 Tax=Candidatus Cyanaurora vandensis TaxID=2714958 RepID=UPI002580C66C|nr:hypothetical protein [Candidatus Cyanaurora vandensis]
MKERHVAFLVNPIYSENSKTSFLLSKEARLARRCAAIKNLAPHRRPPEGETAMQQLVGKFPGEESEEELEKMIKEI